jgi:hypothetical protein
MTKANSSEENVTKASAPVLHTHGAKPSDSSE